MSPPIPISEAQLSGEFWALTSYFNPAGYRNKRENLEQFADGIRAQGLKLLIVELAFEDRGFELRSGIGDLIERRRTRTVLWQKERLLNIGLGRLPPECDKVAWLDGDVIFENDDWVAACAELLNRYVIVQPFTTACWLAEATTELPPGSELERGNKEGQYLPGMGYAMAHAPDQTEALRSYFTHGHTGFGWTARREVLDRHGFYDAQILGNGDFVMAHAMYGNRDFWEGRNWECARLSPALLSHIVEWSRPFHDDVGGSVYYVPGRVLHLWHGNQRDRQYDDRLNLLKEHDFDPRTDLVLDDDGLWKWGANKPGLEEWAAGYFASRREE